MRTKTKLLSLASVAALGLGSCASDELQETYQGEEITFTSRVSRAELTTIKSLDGFYVYADAVGYPNLFIDGVKAEKENGQNDDSSFALEKKFIWPMDVNKMRFWAYGPLSINEMPGFEASFNTTTQHLSDFTATPDIKNAGQYHKDLVVAYTESTREAATGMRVPLTFHHALSQIAVRIKKGANFEDGRIVKVKGAWLMNVHSKGTLEFSNNIQDTDHMKWSTSSPANYGREIEESKLGNSDGISVISNDGNGGLNTTLMVVPQKFIKFPFDNSAAAIDDKTTGQVTNYNRAGTYIMILCRVETKHEFPATGTETDAIGSYDGYHIHQLFPVVKKDGNLVYDENAYGYTCVPIEGTWLPGKKYIYTLEFCGKTSGAGVYPPDSHPEGFPPGTDRPDDKKPGDPVLEKAISFTVDVSVWEDNSSTEPMP